MATKGLIIEPCVHIPYEGPEDEDEDAHSSDPTMPTLPDLEELDLPCGSRLRLEAFEHVWEEYNGRLMEVVSEMHAPVVAKAVEAVLNAYADVSPLLLHTELPVVAVSGPDRRGTATICAGLRSALCGPQGKKHDDEDEMPVDHSDTPVLRDKSSPQALISSMGSSDCVNLTSAMKALIAGFTNNHAIGDEGLAQTRRKGAVSSSLVPYDINMLDAWFSEYKSVSGQTPKLVVFVNEFEDVEPLVMQDLFYICSLHIPRLPLVFVLALSSPNEPSFLHAVYPRATLALLQLKRIGSTGGADTLQSLLLKVLYETSYEPPVQLGPSAIDFLVEQFARNSGSVEVICGLLKLVLLRHFMHPLSVFSVGELLGEDSLEDACQLLSEDSSEGFLQLLLGRLYNPDRSTLRLPKKKHSWPIGSAQDVLDTVRDLRTTHLREARARRVAFRVFLLVRDFMLDKGYKTAADGRDGKSVLGMMSACLRGTAAAKEGNLKYLASMTRKLPEAQLKELLQQLYQFFFNQPRVIREEEADAITPVIAKWMGRLDSSGSADDTDTSATDFDHTEISRAVGDWLLLFFDERFQNYTETNLWDIWYTGNPVAISEVGFVACGRDGEKLNFAVFLLSQLTSPAPRVNVIGALLHPIRYLEHNASEDHDEPILPDTSLLFQRYLESGRMLNMHDWYESFATALDADRSEKGLKEVPLTETTPRRRGATGRPTKRKGKGKERSIETPSRRKGRQQDGMESPADRDSEEEDGWKTEMHVRFLRGVQELDFMGFVKHTKRKAEHVLKTVHEPPEY